MEKKPGFWDRLRELRGTLSQEEFSKKIGVSLRAYQRYESGERVPPPHILSKIAALLDTTIDWIITGDLNIEKAIMLERARESFYLEDLVEKLEETRARTLRLKLIEAKENATEEEMEKISKILEDENTFLNLMRKQIEENIEQAKEVKHFEQISYRSPLYSIFRQIEKMFNKGERAKIDAIKALLTAFESNKDDDRAKINVFKVLVAVFESELEK